MLNKSVKRIALLALVLLMILAVFAVPAAATPPEPVTFQTTITYTLGDLDSGAGTWSSAAQGGGWATESSDNAGYYRPDWPGWRVRTFHNETVLSDDNGSITIRSQMRTTYFDPLYLEAVGQWTIISGEGDYETLRGSGSFTASGEVDLNTFTLTTETDYTGTVHLDP
ncbi:MAG: hypothetical protein AMJ56_12130 [Anaerolineae bacterium SG8_19]|jgi:hypothetical protein|nr:MAG: hypothetical protein AMJ56_12130 [Anaerolineae bacterium SG8_19]